MCLSLNDQSSSISDALSLPVCHTERGAATICFRRQFPYTILGLLLLALRLTSPLFNLNLDAFIGFSAHFSSSPLPTKKELRTSQAFDTKLRLSRCPLALCPVTR